MGLYDGIVLVVSSVMTGTGAFISVEIGRDRMNKHSSRKAYQTSRCLVGPTSIGVHPLSLIPWVLWSSVHLVRTDPGFLLVVVTTGILKQVWL